MNILILTKYFPPEIGAASHLFYELAESLVDKGHEVTVVTGFPTYNVDKDKLDAKYKWKLLLSENMNGIEVERIRTISLPERFPYLEKLDHILDPAILSFRGLIESGELIFIYSPPLPLGILSYLLGRLKRIPVIVNIQDLFPKEAIDLGLINNGFLIKLLKSMEKYVYKKADLLTVHSKGNKQHLVSHGADPNKVRIVHNWVDTEVIAPGPRMNSFRKEFELGDKFIVSFAGTMGQCQDMNVIIECARKLQDYDKILFLLVGNGSRKQDAIEKGERYELSNIRFLPMQPKEKYPLLLNASDVGLVTLDPSLKTPVVPSKLFSIMASGRPAVASMNLEGDAPRIIKEANCGFCVEAGNVDGLTNAILKLYQNEEQRRILGQNGREYAVENLSREVVIRTYEKLFKKVIEGKAGKN